MAVKRLKFDEIKRAEYLKLLRQGKNKSLAAHDAAVSCDTVQRYCNLNPEFQREVSKAEIAGAKLRVGRVEDALYEAAASGNVTAIQVFLYNRAADRWSDRRAVKTEVSGPNGGPISVERKIEELTDEQLAIIAAEGIVRVAQGSGYGVGPAANGTQ